MIQEHNDLLITGLLEGANSLSVNNTTLFYDSDKRVCVSEQLPPGDWDLIGLYPGLTEEQAARCVESYPISRWEDLRTGVRFFKYYPDSHNVIKCETAIESFSSLMDHLKLYTVNPYGNEPEMFYESDRMIPCKYEYPHGFDIEQFKNDHDLWQEAQSRTFPLWAVLKRKTDGNK